MAMRTAPWPSASSGHSIGLHSRCLDRAGQGWCPGPRLNPTSRVTPGKVTQHLGPELFTRKTKYKQKNIKNKQIGGVREKSLCNSQLCAL